MSKYASKPESVTVRQNISAMGHLNRYDSIQEDRVVSPRRVSLKIQSRSIIVLNLNAFSDNAVAYVLAIRRFCDDDGNR